MQAGDQRLLRPADLRPGQLRDGRRPPVQVGPGREGAADRGAAAITWSNPNFDPKTADLPGLELLGERQLKFLRDWAADWRGAEMKAVISQTIFTAMATTHGANASGSAPTTTPTVGRRPPRNAALREIRKAFAVHIAGDQHLPAVVHYGIDEHGDAGVAFAGPAVNVGYPRWWEPRSRARTASPGAPENTGDFLDSFGNPMTVLACANRRQAGRGCSEKRRTDKPPAWAGAVRQAARTVTVECWPFLADPVRPGTQFPGWPVTVARKTSRRPAIFAGWRSRA